MPFLLHRTRYILCLALLFTLVGSMFAIHASAQSEEDEIIVFVDTTQVEFQVYPVIIDGTTLVPVRPLFEALGLEVGWNEEEQLVTGKTDGLEVTLKIGEARATVNQDVVPLLRAAEIQDGWTLVPLRFIGEATGAFVVWDPYNREISVVTEAFMAANHITREQLEREIELFFAEMEEKMKDSTESTPPEPEEEDETPSEPAVPAKPVDLAALDGMYYGFRSDFGGYECGGMCWDLYTFLPDRQVLIGLPEHGGPETIDCATEECFGYTVEDGLLKLDNGESLPIEKSDDGFLKINKVKLDSVLPVEAGTMLENEYMYLGYRGLIGIDAAASSWRYYMTLREDGTYETSNFAIGSVGATSNPSTHVGVGSEALTGTYEIKGNTITFTATDGTVTSSLFFIHNDNPEGSVDDIQIGARNFYVD